MTQLHITKIHISFRIKIPHEILEKHLAASVEIVGEALTQNVVDQVNEKKIGYFPALEFLQKQGGLDEDLVDAAETIGWFSSKFAREEVQKKMRSFFSTLSFKSIQTLAFTMPNVRPNQINAYQALVDHYTPNTVKLDVIASLLKKEKLEGIENWAKQLFKRNLSEAFNDFEVTGVSVIDDPANSD